MVIRPPRRRGVIVGAAVVLLALCTAVTLTVSLLARPVGPATATAGLLVALLLALALVFAYWTLVCWSLHYHLNRDRLAIRWLGHEQRIPLSDLLELLPAVALRNPTRLRGLIWSGFCMARGVIPGPNPPAEVLFFCTNRWPGQMLYVRTATQLYALTLPDRYAFTQELKLRLSIGPARVLEHAGSTSGFPALPAWRDRALLALFALALAANAALFGFQAALMPILPEQIVIALPIAALNDGNPKTALFLLPAIGLGLLLANSLISLLLHQRERLAAYLFVICAIIIQGVLWYTSLDAVV